MQVVGLDLSLRATGVATSAGVRTLSPPRGVVGVDRLAWLRDALEYVIRRAGGFDVAAVEGYSFGAKGSAVYQLGELGGVVRLLLRDLGTPIAVVPPSSLKKYACGSGAARKEQVLVAAVHRLGYDGHSTDASDALWLLHMALDHYGLSGAVKVPASHRTALSAVDWPRLPAAATSAAG